MNEGNNTSNAKKILLGIFCFILFLLLVLEFGLDILKGISIDLPHVFNHPASLVFILFFFGLICRAFLLSIGIDRWIFMPEALMVAATVGLMVEVPHIRDSVGNGHKSNISGKWVVCLKTYNNVIHEGSANILNNEYFSYSDPYLNLDLRISFESISPKDHSSEIIVWTQLGHLSNNGEFRVIYKNTNNEVGIFEGNVMANNPDKINIKYADLYGYDKNDDPEGEIVLLREGSFPDCKSFYNNKGKIKN